MESEEVKKYNVLENILQKINKKYIALSPEETKRNNKLLQVIDKIIQDLKNKSVLFNNLYKNKFYGGSFYDGLKVGNPSEYDLDCVLCLPKIASPCVVVSNKPGYVHVVLKNMEALQKSTEAPKYADLHKLLDGNRLSTKKVKSWMEGLVAAAVTGKNKQEIDLDDSKCIFTCKIVKSGPALTVKLDGEHNGDVFTVDIDLVPCFIFFDDHWPKKGYRVNPSKHKNTFFVVPKSPDKDDSLHWRLSFQEQERELISGFAVMKPTIRLIKKIRDRHQHKIASYYIKSIFLWEVGNIDKNLWNKSLSFVLTMMLRKYYEYIEKRKIPYYWNESNNLIEDLSEVAASCIANKIRNIVDQIDKICIAKTDPYGIVTCFLSKEEVDLEVFKQDVPLKKKFLKQIAAVKLLDSPNAPNVSSKPESPASSSLSTASSFEEISKDVFNEQPSTSSEMFSKLETMCLALASEQKRMFEMLETLIDKVESCESHVKRLTSVVEKKFLDEKRSNEMSVDEIMSGLSNQCTNNLTFDFQSLNL